MTVIRQNRGDAAKNVERYETNGRYSRKIVDTVHYNVTVELGNKKKSGITIADYWTNLR
jgi:hypothetical protein